MKKINYFLMLMLGIFTLTFASCNDDDEAGPISEALLPQTAKTFLSQYFSNAEVAGITMKTDDGKKEYEVYMTNGMKIKFDELGDWTDVDAPTGQIVPEGFVPEKIASYVSENYPNYGINEISKERYGYDVDLTNGLDLVFNADGDFVRIDK